jgi:uncharacterized membrane protein YeaQ/YmgE (transglycosylase-associated protein family)
MTFEAGAWVAGILGALAGVVASRLSATRLTGGGWVDRVMGAVGGIVLALLAYGVLSLLEGWAAFFQRTASPVIPLLFTVTMLAGWVLTLWLLRRRRRR